MRWKGRRISTNVEDRRGGGAKAGGISILGLLLLLLHGSFLGLTPNRLIRRPRL